MPHPTKILAVDDRPENLFALEAALTDSGYKIIEAHSGEEALELAKEHDFAVILLDVQMPNMDGFETAKRLRAQKRSAVTPIIFVTALHKSESYEIKGYGAGAVDYLFKPLSIDILKAKIAVFVELYKKNEENLRQAELLKKAELREQEIKLLKEAVATRDEFLAMAAHELKTPITPLSLQIQAFIQMYKDNTIEGVPRDRLIRMLETSNVQVERLSKVIDELRGVVQITSGKLEVLLETFDLSLLIKDVIQSFSGPIQNSGSLVSVDVPEGLVGFWDRRRLEQVVINLLTNALKYGRGQPIQISAWKQQEQLHLQIRDQGIGIAIEDQERVFNRFERAVSTRHYSGLGVGLFIVDTLVRLHGGKIRLESKLGEGSTFTVELPLQAVT
ncbi:MAG: ATP-binding protein [Pseudobdellovibrionaceae bacterium]